ncbi:MAG: hypothetical protein RIT27_180 [Pseudomonadota bacterium]|jgi:hypothetical protein
MSSLNKKLIFFVSFLSITSISYANGLFSADFFCTIAQQTNGKCPELPTDEQSLINVLSNLLYTEFKTVYDSLPICAADEKLENNVCVKIPQPIQTTTPSCKVDETLVDGICRTTRIQLCEEKNWGVYLDGLRSQTCFNNVIIKNGQFSNENIISEKASVELSIQIFPDISQIGMEADTLLFAFRYAPNNEEWVKDRQNWRTWSLKDWRGTSSELPSDSQRIKLGYNNSNELTFDSFIPIFSGELKGFAGSYFLIYAGYRLEDGSVICNCKNPFVLHVVN